MKTILVLLTCILISTQAFAESVKSYQGRYIAKFVAANTIETSRLDLGESPAQQGRFKFVFVRDGWNELTKEEKQTTYKRLIMTGVVTGKFDTSTGYARHILTSYNRKGTLFTNNDLLIPISGDLACSTQEVMQANELMNFTHGTGKYHNLTSGQVLINGTINTCFGHPEFLQNDFSLADTESYLEFSATN